MPFLCRLAVADTAVSRKWTGPLGRRLNANTRRKGFAGAKVIDYEVRQSEDAGMTELDVGAAGGCKDDGIRTVLRRIGRRVRVGRKLFMSS